MYYVPTYIAEAFPQKAFTFSLSLVFLIVRYGENIASERDAHTHTGIKNQTIIYSGCSIETKASLSTL